MIFYDFYWSKEIEAKFGSSSVQNVRQRGEKREERERREKTFRERASNCVLCMNGFFLK